VRSDQGREGRKGEVRVEFDKNLMKGVLDL